MKFKTIFVLLFFCFAIIGIIAPISAQGASISSEDKVYTVESKKKAVSLKITWNANGGKIGSKKTTITSVKKGNKLNKLLASPKRSGYTFKGWYTKKTGGTKISKNTKPAKSVTYYAQWTKGTLNTEEKRLIGKWVIVRTTDERWEFKNDGTFTNTLHNGGVKYQGVYSVNNGVLTVKRQGSSSTFNYGIKFGFDNSWGQDYIELDYKNWWYWLRYYKTR